jgi:EAL domain-containing protein (putative c-di-GMP-specific phosphodiesterase class I)
MYQAKQQGGGGYRIFDAKLREGIASANLVRNALQESLARGEFRLHYQPLVDLHSNRITGLEALLRWEHPVHGKVSPSEFVAIAEATDLIQPLTEWTIVESLKQTANWRHAGLETRIAVNLSARALQDVEFPHHLERLLARFSVEGNRLELEITETAMMLDPQRALAIVRDLQALGVRIAIDDFGTGYSSLGYLRDLRASALKLDKSFVIDLESREQNRVIVESTAQMAEALGLEVVAEGVESQWVCDYLRDAGYTIGQGYWFGKAMPAAALIERYAARAGTQQAIAS